MRFAEAEHATVAERSTISDDIAPSSATRATMTSNCTHVGHDRSVIAPLFAVNVAAPVGPGRYSRRQTPHRRVSTKVGGTATHRAAVMTDSHRAAVSRSGIPAPLCSGRWLVEPQPAAQCTLAVEPKVRTNHPSDVVRPAIRARRQRWGNHHVVAGGLGHIVMVGARSGVVDTGKPPGKNAYTDLRFRFAATRDVLQLAHFGQAVSSPRWVLYVTAEVVRLDSGPQLEAARSWGTGVESRRLRYP